MNCPGEGDAWPDRADAHSGPLDGVRVLDLTAFAVGPWAATLLAQLGADVVKIEPPSSDGSRLVKPTKHGEPTTYSAVNLGKRSVELDLRTDADRAVAVDLARAAHVFVENSRPGAMDRLGLGYDDVAVVNPAIVYCSSSSFGDAGPMMLVGSTDPQGQAFSGFASLNGQPGRLPELLRYPALVDLSTSMYLVQAVLAGLHVQRRTGQGQHVRTSQMEAAIALQSTRFAEFLADGCDPRRLGSAVASVAPSRAFRCADGRFVNVTANTPASWQALCEVLARPDLGEDARFRTNGDRVGNRGALDHTLAEEFARLPAHHWLQVLGRAGVPSGPYLSLEDAELHTHVRANGFVERVPHPVRGDLAVAGMPWEFARTPARTGRPSLPGTDTDRVKAAVAGAGR